MHSPIATEDTLESLLAFHRRVERHLAGLTALPAHLDLYGPGPAACATAGSLLQCFDHECARRHAEEERELWPRLERGIHDGGQLAAFRALRRALAEQHRGIERAWRTMRRPLQAVGEGVLRRLDAAQVAEFRALFASHIHAEEAALHRVVAAASLLASH